MEVAITMNGGVYKKREMHSKKAMNALLDELGDVIHAKTEAALIGK